MVTYEFYWRDEEWNTLIGILPERKHSQERITRQSVTSWIRTVLGDALDLDFDRIYFIRLEV